MSHLCKCSPFSNVRRLCLDALEQGGRKHLGITQGSSLSTEVANSLLQRTDKGKPFRNGSDQLSLEEKQQEDVLGRWASLEGKEWNGSELGNVDKDNPVHLGVDGKTEARGAETHGGNG